MGDVLLVLLAGLLTGFLARRKSGFIVATDNVSVKVVFLLLFLLGVSVGGNRNVLTNLRSVGIHAAAISVAGVAGSVGFSILLSRFFLRRSGREK